ncbi:2,3,4,5-tetrahydropyridine-2,6-dicarboxylate N-succinyltransferase [Brevundimonas sp. 2R-24]|uniref:2,3,4,5-tetrahydropyridine-2,6-dicarboxylate N-succinyltransferase n=1 Tax=Peiella sedimenti TaxID=3061083 RepID=A0ABT8SKT7_9CAUL|nr:2,3,4,5-tetrahydropyridine-2,6-dicarboxylate N-succinyltransferase [Caulobacteraceae bacterium XZ-24]
MIDLAAVKIDVEEAWERRAEISAATKGRYRDAVDHALQLLDEGRFRVAERVVETGEWKTSEWLKKAVLLSFRLHPNEIMHNGRHEPLGVGPWWDKVPNKFSGWKAADFDRHGFRAVPGAIVRRGAHIGRNVVLMPSFVNIGAFVDEGSMVDAWATVGSCAQIGKNVHLSGGAGIGGVLEPLQASPTIIEDGCFIGARAEVAEGVIVREGAVLAMGVYLSASTKIVDRATGEVLRGEVPAYSVVVPGSLPDPKGGPSLYCAVIVKRVDAQTRAKTGVNELLRD